MPVKSWVGRGARSPAFGALAALLERVDRGRHGTLAVLTYHRVAPLDTTVGYPGLISAEPGEFREQMAFIAARYLPVSMANILDHLDGRAPLPPRAIHVTFDDAYEDFADVAWPILRALGVPATLFVPTTYPGQRTRSFWWDWLYIALMRSAVTTISSPAGDISLRTVGERRSAYRLLRSEVKKRAHPDAMALVEHVAEQTGVPQPAGIVLDWEELRRLAAEGVTLAPHSREHALLTRVPEEELVAEIGGSRDDLADRLGEAMPVFAYPSGAHSGRVRAVTRQLGFRAAFTTERGVNDLDRCNRLALRRVNVGRNSSLNAIRAQIGRWALLWS